MKIFNFYTNAPRDKELHFLVGAAIGLIASILILWRASKGGWYMDFWFIKNLQVVFVGLFFATLAGLLKEIVWDALLGKGTFEVADAKYTIYGGLTTSVLVWFISLFLNIIPPYIKIESEAEYLERRIKETHQNDRKSFDNNSQELKDRSDSLKKVADKNYKILFEESKNE